MNSAEDKIDRITGPEFFFREEGYVILPNLICDNLIERFSAYVRANSEHFGRNDFEGQKTKRIYSLITESRIFDEFIENETMLSLIRNFIGEKILLSRSQAISIFPGEQRQKLHRDSMAFPAKAPSGPTGISVILALDDFEKENGGTVLVPGSHKWEQLRFPAEKEMVSAVMPKGSALLFVDDLYHCGGENISQNSRSALFLHFTVPWMRQIDNILPYFPIEKAKNLPVAIQELIGYDIYDNNGIIYGVMGGRHPKKFLMPKT